MSKRKASLLDVEIKCKKVKIVNFCPMDIVMLSSLFMETGDTLHKTNKARKEIYAKAKDYRSWVKPLLTKERSWSEKRLADSRHLVGLELKEAENLYDFIFKFSRELKVIDTQNANNIRKKLLDYNQLINETIKNLKAI